LFPKGFKKDTQVIATVMSSDKVNQTDVMALTAASAALHVSDIPWAGPIAGIRVARVDGELICYPTFEQTEAADIELVVAVSKDAFPQQSSVHAAGGTKSFSPPKQAKVSCVSFQAQYQAFVRFAVGSSAALSAIALN